MSPNRALPWLTAAALLAAACSSPPAEKPTAASATPTAKEDADLRVQVASYDVAANEDSRIIIGLLTADNELITGGDVTIQFFDLADQANPRPGPVTTGKFLPVPGKEPEVIADQPTVGSALDGVGVYQATVTFDVPGQWGVVVQADLAGLGVMTGTGTLDVVAEHQVPAVGDAAISVTSPVMTSDVEPTTIDSRAQGGVADVPDPELHQVSISTMLAEGRPQLIVFSTPVYCLSQFCGPVTDVVADLATEFSDRAAFIHVEVWGDFEEKLGNEAAAKWLLTPDGGFAEPWIYLVDASGTITGRWDNVPDLEDITNRLTALPLLDEAAP